MTRQFKGKRVAIVGLSVEGIDSVRFFSQFDDVTILCCDRRTQQELGQIYQELSQFHVSFQLGESYLSHLEGYDIIVRTPGISSTLPEFISLKEQGKDITSLTKLFFDCCTAKIIGVTGTKGKGTTSTLIATMLQEYGRRVFLGGNVGTPLLSKIREIRPSDWVVLELSSFQLEDLHKSPHIAVVLRVTQDHLANYDRLATNFHPTREAYVEAKKSVVRFQKKNDIVILNADDPTSSSFSTETTGRCFLFSRTKDTADAYVQNHRVYVRWDDSLFVICDAKSIKLRGEHNLENIAAATLAAMSAGVSTDAIQRAVLHFEGLEHRLEYVKGVDGVSYFNDSFSTVPDTAIAAIQSFVEPIILIVGGSEKGSDFTELGKAIVQSSVKAIIIIGDMTDRILKAVKEAQYQGKVITGCKTMHDIVQQSKKEARSGDVVLLSPACASFDMFKNYKERGKQFRYEVSLL